MVNEILFVIPAPVYVCKKEDETLQINLNGTSDILTIKQDRGNGAFSLTCNGVLLDTSEEHNDKLMEWFTASGFTMNAKGLLTKQIDRVNYFTIEIDEFHINRWTFTLNGKSKLVNLVTTKFDGYLELKQWVEDNLNTVSK